MKNEMTFTYQTRLKIDNNQTSVLQACAELLNKVERSLFTEMSKGKTSASCKNHFLKLFGITARQFNACRVSVEGKVCAFRTSQDRAIASLKDNISSLDKQIQRLEKKPSQQSF